MLLGLYLVYLLLPIALLVVGAFGQSWTNTLLPSGITGAWFLQVASDRSFQRAFASSLLVAGSTILVCAAVGAPLAYALAASASRGVRLAGRIVHVLPIAAPPIVLGFGFLLVFSSDALPFLGATWLLVAGHVVLCLPYLLMALVADIRHLGLAEQERAAESLGAGFSRRFVDVVLPNLRQSLLTGSITVAALSIGEFQLSNLVAAFQNRTYPVVLLQAFYGATGFACAATVVLLLLAVAASLGGAASAQGAAAARGAGA